MAAGTSGTAGKRSLPVTASALSCPDAIWPWTAETVSHSTSTCLPRSADVASGELRNGTCSMSTPAICFNNSPAKCWVAPKPGLAKVILPGLAFAAATSSFTLSAGKNRRVAMSNPPPPHFFQIRGGKTGGGKKERPRRGHKRYGLEGGQGVVTQRLAHDGGDDLAGGHDAQGVAILLRARDGLIAKRSGGAGPILHHNGLAELLLHGLRKNAADDDGAAARAK